MSMLRLVLKFRNAFPISHNCAFFRENKVLPSGSTPPKGPVKSMRNPMSVCQESHVKFDGSFGTEPLVKDSKAKLNGA